MIFRKTDVGFKVYTVGESIVKNPHWYQLRLKFCRSNSSIIIHHGIYVTPLHILSQPNINIWLEIWLDSNSRYSENVMDTELIVMTLSISLYHIVYVASIPDQWEWWKLEIVKNNYCHNYRHSCYPSPWDIHSFLTLWLFFILHYFLIIQIFCVHNILFLLLHFTIGAGMVE